ncbi:MAG: glycosyltransferase, partial [Armatimonadota bacterium]
MRSGVVIAVESISRTLRAMGHEVTIFTSRHPDVQAPEQGVIYFPAVMLPSCARYPLAIPLATGKARRMLLESHFDVIHSHSPMILGHVAQYYHRHRGIPLVFTYHTLIEEYTHYIPLPQTWLRRSAIALSRHYCNAADHVIAPSEHVRNRLLRYRVEKPITIIPTGVDLAMLDATPAGTFRQAYGIPTTAPLLCYAGRLAREKNLLRLVQAFRLVHAVESEAHLLLIGGGPLVPALTAMIQQHDLRN